ncbi:hypothetical protein ACLMJK_001852 [Lecanora helva]
MVERLQQTALALSLDIFHVHPVPSRGHTFPSSKVHLRVRPLPCSTTTEQIDGFEIPGLSIEARLIWNRAHFDRLLDACVPDDPPVQSQEPDLPYDLTKYKQICRRFCHCMSILRNLDQCTIDLKEVDFAKGYQLVVGFICGLSTLARSIWLQIFEEVRACCFAKRQKDRTRALMFIITDHLGEIYKEISSFDDTPKHRDSSPLFESLFFDVERVLTDIEALAKGLRIENFNFEKRSMPLLFGGLDIVLPFNLPNANHFQAQMYKSIMTFSEILAYSHGSVQRPQEGFPTMIAADNDPLLEWRDQVTGYGENFCTDVSLPCGRSTSRNESFHFLGDVAENSDHCFASGGVDWDAGDSNGLDPNWAMPFNSLMSAAGEISLSAAAHASGVALPLCDSPSTSLVRPPWPSVSLEPSAYEMQQSIHNIIGESSTTTSNLIRPLSENLDCARSTTTNTSPTDGQPVLNPSQSSKRPGKRKRLSFPLSCKKQQKAPKRADADDVDNDSIVTSATSRSPNPAPLSPKSGPGPVGGLHVPCYKPNDDLPSMRTFRTDWVKDWENGATGPGSETADIVRDFNVVDCDRRPMSWPLRRHFRKSLDISVAVLTKPFEKKMQIENE